MKSHDLARMLLDLPDADVMLYVYGHRYSTTHDHQSHGDLEIALSSWGYFDKVKRIMIGPGIVEDGEQYDHEVELLADNSSGVLAKVAPR